MSTINLAKKSMDATAESDIPQANFTPGPWFIQGHDIIDREVRWDESGARLGTTPNGIARVELYPETPVSKGSREANAHLIAAAPMMHGALVAARKWMGERPTGEQLQYPHGISAAMVIDALDMALRAATGLKD